MANLRAYDSHLYGNPQTPASPKVSVCFITYNHAPYIRIALDSIIEQITDFDFELVIGDDCSTDGTTAIVKEYADAYPHLIRAYIHPENLTKYGSPGKLNFVHAFSVCRGEYIVHIEGDDYFCYPHKLQKQADFLDANPQFSACFHNALMKYEDNTGRTDHPINTASQPKEIRPMDLLYEREVWFMATASVMFRKQLIGDEFPQWFLASKSGDIPLYVMLSDMAPIAYASPEVWSVYRRHTAGMSYTDSNFDLNFLENRIGMYRDLDSHTQGRYHAAIQQIIADYYYLCLTTRQLEHSQKLRLRYFLQSLKYKVPNLSELNSLIFNKVLTPFNQQRLRRLTGRAK